MPSQNPIFQGNVFVHLQGENALFPFGEIRNDLITYFIGSQSTTLRIKDHRGDPIQAAKLAISGVDEKDFANVFNQPAYAEIYISQNSENQEQIEINLHSTEIEKTDSILWMGVIDQSQIPAAKISWEFFRPLSKNRYAFAILAEDC